MIRFQRPAIQIHDASFELGEFFYQLRAALDCLAFTGVRQKTGDPVPNENRIYFGSSALSVQAGGGKLDMFDKLKG